MKNSVLKLLKSLDVSDLSDLMAMMLDNLYANDILDALIKNFEDQLYLNDKEFV